MAGRHGMNAIPDPSQNKLETTYSRVKKPIKFGIACMKNNLVPQLNQCAGGQLTKSICGAGDKDPCHTLHVSVILCGSDFPNQ